MFPCAVYRLPGNSDIMVLAQKKPGLNKLKFDDERGFLFAPFKPHKNAGTVLIRPDVYTVSSRLAEADFAVKTGSEKLNKIKPLKLKAAGKKAYVQYVKDILKRIKKGELQKVVAARIALKKKPVGFEPVAYFEKLCRAYPSSFVSLVFTPQHGTWIGATPEVLLQVNQSGFKTYSLAGTRANTVENLKSPWGEKEKSEHKFVSQYIHKAFKSIDKRPPIITGPETVTAGNLLHLRTVYQQQDAPPSKWLEVVKKLHPTPAVAGYPAKKAVEFILKNEGQSRSYYSGYLGPVNMDNQVNLFVNLRCMQVLDKQLAMHVGCGIVAGSNPEDEWKESALKTQTLLNVLE
jgi:isochorismate synthase